MTPVTATRPPATPARPGASRPRRRQPGESRRTALFAHGEPMIWLTGGSLAIALLMIVGLLGLVFAQGFGTFWPGEVLRVRTTDGRVLAGEVTREESYVPVGQEGALPQRRRLLRIGNYELTGEHFQWVTDAEVVQEDRPAWFLVVERVAWGRFYGEPVAFQEKGVAVAQTPEAAWALYEERHDAARERRERRRHLETDAMGDVNGELEALRLAVRRAELEHGLRSPQAATAQADFDVLQPALEARYAEIKAEIAQLDARNAEEQLVLRTADGQDVPLELSDVVLAYPANQLGFVGRLGVYVSRWVEFLTDEPREANSEGGVWPAIFGTVMMTLIMSVLVVPFGVLAALYLREYARPGFITSAVRVAVNNLAGVPSIVFGVFGLGFFCYIVGARIDELLFMERLPSPTFGTGGILWASLTLALLTLPVVIVATEEALAAVPGSMREGSYACGASKWQTIRRIVLPRAMPGIMTGMILALARGAGEVAPLMLVGAVKLAPELPFDGTFPFLHLERSFMHLGFHIYDLGFQSPNSEAAKPMVFTTTLLLIALVVLLNVTAVAVRSRLRSRYVTGKF
jgi:phosphate transport system permease protein